MNEKPLGHFFRYKRSTANLKDYGIVQDTHRRARGLTREEVAERAHLSTDWYVRIEQDRSGVNPSVEILKALCEVLKLNESEINYVFNLVEKKLPPELNHVADISEDFIRLLNFQNPYPAFIMDRNFIIQETNRAFVKLYGKIANKSKIQQNLLWQTFKNPVLKALFSDWNEYAAERVAQFRQLYSENPTSSYLYKIYEIIKDEPDFSQPWEQLDVLNMQTLRLLLNHPQVGELYLTETTLISSSKTHFLIIQSAADQTTETKLKQLGQSF
ncbi:helix-turn-helix domain-containing protein [Pediococcus ethanolidurans]|uniref:helix-turn-helix domain-containing protein n=1 Tax=Pediococcus ethanolidurans TaxID=319653 RepID=UPI0029545C95|nr:helix-turn-helix transcriptional regulator [Pediococcus ethanolidurans]MDV7720120.1 helix-turn-helix domain-containing protein [Pediococcus ethanolidurans]